MVEELEKDQVRKRKSSVHSARLLAGLLASATIQLRAYGPFEDADLSAPLSW